MDKVQDNTIYYDEYYDSMYEFIKSFNKIKWYGTQAKIIKIKENLYFIAYFDKKCKKIIDLNKYNLSKDKFKYIHDIIHHLNASISSSIILNDFDRYIDTLFKIIENRG